MSQLYKYAYSNGKSFLHIRSVVWSEPTSHLTKKNPNVEGRFFHLSIGFCFSWNFHPMQRKNGRKETKKNIQFHVPVIQWPHISSDKYFYWVPIHHCLQDWILYFCGYFFSFQKPAPNHITFVRIDWIFRYHVTRLSFFHTFSFFFFLFLLGSVQFLSIPSFCRYTLKHYNGHKCLCALLSRIHKQKVLLMFLVPCSMFQCVERIIKFLPHKFECQSVYIILFEYNMRSSSHHYHWMVDGFILFHLSFRISLLLRFNFVLRSLFFFGSNVCWTHRRAHKHFLIPI